MYDQLTDDEARRLVDAARTRKHELGEPHRNARRDAAILRLMLECGLTVSEIAYLTAGQVGPYGRRYGIELSGARVQSIPADLVHELRELADYPPTPRLFDLTPRAIFALPQHYARAAGIARPLSPTVLRCYFAQCVMQRSCSLDVVARSLGVSARAAVKYLGAEIAGEPAALNSN